jgi:hypothetical protein
MGSQPLDLQVHATAGTEVQRVNGAGWRLSVQSHADGAYRDAQVDDYLGRKRRRFLWSAPCRLSLDARVSSDATPGTWGFGLWNDPFNFSLGLGGADRRLPALPEAAWFFYASPPNYLSLRDDLPAQGFLAATFSAPILPAPLLAGAAPFLPLLGWPWAARRLRPAARWLVKQDAVQLEVERTAWHHYQLDWQPAATTFTVDGQVVLATPVSPRGQLGLVMWIDNQYAAFTPHGRLSFGRLPTPEAVWLEIKAIRVETPGQASSNDL